MHATIINNSTKLGLVIAKVNIVIALLFFSVQSAEANVNSFNNNIHPTNQGGTYHINNGSVNINISNMFYCTVNNMRTKKYTSYQIFNNKHAGSWKVIKPSKIEVNLKLPKTKF